MDQWVRYTPLAEVVNYILYMKDNGFAKIIIYETRRPPPYLCRYGINEV